MIIFFQIRKNIRINSGLSHYPFIFFLRYSMTVKGVLAFSDIYEKRGIGVAKYCIAMKHLLVCSSNPILTKNLYGILRDGGFDVDSIEHPAFAVQKVLGGSYDAVILDSEPFGLSAEEAVAIIKTVAPALPVLYVGAGQDPAQSGERSLDLEKLRQTIKSIAV